VRFVEIAGASILGLAIAMLPGLAVATQLLAVVLAIAPAFSAGAHRAKGGSGRSRAGHSRA